MKGRAVKEKGQWVLKDPEPAEWYNILQFKSGRHLVVNTKTEFEWNQWLVKSKGKTIILIIFEYGSDITTARDYDEFVAVCIRPQTDRAGATTEASLRDIAEKLQDHWGSSFQATEQIADPPPVYFVQLLNATHSQVAERVTRIIKSAEMALDCVNSSLADNEEIQNDLEALRLSSHKKNLISKRTIVESFLADIDLMTITDVIDPFSVMENLQDTEHEE